MPPTEIQHGGIHRKKKKGNDSLLIMSLLFNFLLLIGLFFTYPICTRRVTSGEVTFHGGHPADILRGTCYCSGEDTYCMCNPSLAIDLVIFSGPSHIWFVRRKDTAQLAIMGGFVNVGESVEDAVKRELKEETGLTLSSTNIPQLIGIYSDPRRDNRRHTASAAYAIHLDGTEKPIANDDVNDVERIPIVDIETKDFFSDHKTIVKDYIKLLQGKTVIDDFKVSDGDFASNIRRSICLPTTKTIDIAQ